MALKNIPLPAIVIANLYKYCVVEFQDNKRKPVQQGTDVIFLGGNNKHILLLVNYAEAKLLPDEQLTFLTEILNACKLSLDDVAIVNLYNREVSGQKDIPDFLQSAIIILFGMGLSTLELPFKIPPFQVQLYKEKKYVHVPSLNAIQTDTVLKRKLWELLRVLFLP